MSLGRSCARLRRRLACCAAASALALAVSTPALAQTAASPAAQQAASVGEPLWQAMAAGPELALQALSYLGVPYRYASQDPARGFDCSGLVRYVTQAVLGLDLPHSARAMAGLGERVARDALRVGDLLFFNTRGHRNSHVGIYVGDGRFVHAPARGGVVRVEAVDASYWRKRFNGARRLTADAAPAAGEAAEAVALPAEAVGESLAVRGADPGR